MTTHRAVVSSLVLVSLWAFAGCGGKPQHLTKGDEPNRHHEAGFSFVPPADWEIREMPGMKYKPALAKPEDGFAPNVNVVDEMVNMLSASRSYQTNVETMNAAKTLLLKTLTLGQ